MKRRVRTVGSGAVLVFVLSVLAVGCGGSPQPHAAAISPKGVSAPAILARTAAATVPGHSVPVSVESAAAMRAAGNEGPASSIMVPSSCTVTAASATATGTYLGGFVPAVYQRYGDVIDLYVFTRPIAGYPGGIQLADEPFTRHAPFVYSASRRWTVTVPLDRQLFSFGQPARCMVAAQPTMDIQLAP
jgi:hypothetical protein